MITRKTTLILGAGASYPYEFPLGETLKKNIISQILYPHQDQRLNLQKNLIGLGYKQDQLQDFALKLKRSNYMSVDAFLEEWIEYIPIGKVAIAANIIDREIEDNLLENTENGRWYHYLLNLLGNRDNFLNNQLSVITFNYDRSFEYFLYFTLKSRFNLPEQKINEYVKSVRITHVHVQLGLPHFIDENGRKYENAINYGILEKFPNQINIIHESLEESIGFQEARNFIDQAETLIFLGFGYHQKNIERLKIRDYFKGDKIICTFFNRAEGEIQRDTQIIMRNLPTHIINGNRITHYIGDALSFLRNTNNLV